MNTSNSKLNTKLKNTISTAIASHDSLNKFKKNSNSIKKLKSLPLRFYIDSDDFYRRLKKGSVTYREIIDVFYNVKIEDIDLYIPDDLSVGKRKKIINIINFYENEKKRLYDLNKMIDEPNIHNNNDDDLHKNKQPKKKFSEEQIKLITSYLENIEDYSSNPITDTIMENINLFDTKKNNLTASELVYKKSLKINEKWNIIQSNNRPIINNNHIPPINKSQNKYKEKTNNNFLTITKIDNSPKLRNPIILEKKLKNENTKIKNIKEAKILRSGDLRIWFDNKKDTDEAKNDNLSKIFGESASFKEDNNPEKKFVIHRLPKEITKKELNDSIKSIGWNIENIKLSSTNITYNTVTAFVTSESSSERNKILSEKKIKIGFSFFPISEYKSPIITQCYKCYQIGHIAKSCPNTVKCFYCAEEHTKEKCTNKTKLKCVLCSGDHSSMNKYCPQKKKYLLNKVLLKKENSITNKSNQKTPWKPFLSIKEKQSKKDNQKKISEHNISKNLKINLTTKNFENSEFKNKTEISIEEKINALSKEVSKIDELRQSVEKMSALLKGLLP